MIKDIEPHRHKDMEEPVIPDSFWSFLAGIFIGIMLAMMTSCTTTKYVPVPGPTKEVHHNHTDSIHQTDSIYLEKETIIMQLDSEEMARYGIRLQAAERAWLVKTAELERQLKALREMHTDTVHQTDSIPYPVEVPVEVPAQLTWWQEARLWLGNVAIIALVFLCGFGAVKLWMKFRP